MNVFGLIFSGSRGVELCIIMSCLFFLQVKIVQKIKHERQINRARYMPQKPFIIATKTVRPEVYVYDYRKHSDNPTISDGVSFNPDLRLRGHDMGGYGLSWSQFKEGHLLSGSNQICLWDINATPTNKYIDAISMVYTNCITYID